MQVPIQWRVGTVNGLDGLDAVVMISAMFFSYPCHAQMYLRAHWSHWAQVEEAHMPVSKGRMVDHCGWVCPRSWKMKQVVGEPAQHLVIDLEADQNTQEMMSLECATGGPPCFPASAVPIASPFLLDICSATLMIWSLPWLHSKSQKTLELQIWEKLQRGHSPSHEPWHQHGHPRHKHHKHLFCLQCDALFCSPAGLVAWHSAHRTHRTHLRDHKIDWTVQLEPITNHMIQLRMFLSWNEAVPRIFPHAQAPYHFQLYPSPPELWDRVVHFAQLLLLGHPIHTLQPAATPKASRHATTQSLQMLGFCHVWQIEQF